MKWMPAMAIASPFVPPIAFVVYSLQRTRPPTHTGPDDGRVIMKPDCITRERVYKDGAILIYE